MSNPQYNLRSSAVKRLMKEAEELRDATKLFFAQPLEDNLFEWHFTVRGPRDSDFENGLYHGRIILPSDYPMKPPNIILLTPNGRFEINKKICLSISGYHPESWQPSWSIRTALLAIIGFMPTHGGGSIGSLEYPSEERKKLAIKSRDWLCPTCGSIKNKLVEEDVNSTPDSMHQEAKNLANQISFKGEGEKNGTPPKEDEQSGQNGSTAPEPGDRPPQSSPITPEETLIEKGNALLNTLPSTSPGREMLNRRMEMLQRQKGAHQTTAKNGAEPSSNEHNHGQNQGAETSPGDSLICFNLLIGIIALLLALLIGRRLYVANAWRFYSDNSGGGNRDEF